LDIKFQYLSFKYGLKNLLPVSRFVDNVGFLDARSVHTKGPKPRWFKSDGMSEGAISFMRILKQSMLFADLLDSNTIAGDSIVIQFWNNKDWILRRN
jgi:hypothetical protein